LDEEVEKSMTPRSVMEEEMEELTTPWSEMGSNTIKNTLREIGFAHFSNTKAHKTVDIHKK
jgi:hypothetical protein